MLDYLIGKIIPRSTVRTIVGVALDLVCWAITSAAGLLAILQVRSAVNLIWPALGSYRWSLQGIDRLVIFGLGILWLSYVLYVEITYRACINFDMPEGERAGTLADLGLGALARRFVILTGIPLAVYGLSYLAHEIAFRSIFYW